MHPVSMRFMSPTATGTARFGHTPSAHDPKKHPGVHVDSSSSSGSDPEHSIGHFGFYFLGSEGTSFPQMRILEQTLKPDGMFFRPDIIVWNILNPKKKPRVTLQFAPNKGWRDEGNATDALAAKYPGRVMPDRLLYLDVSPDLVRRKDLVGKGKEQRQEAALSLAMNKELKDILGSTPAQYSREMHAALDANIAEAQQMMRDTKPVYAEGKKAAMRRKTVGLRRFMGKTAATRWLRKKLISPLLKEKREARALA